MVREHAIDTRLIHAGDVHPRVGGAGVLPIFQSTVFETRGGGAYRDIVYPRLGNTPNHLALGRKLAAIEAGEAGLVCASGMAAISAALFAALRPGGHVLAQDGLYGGTLSFLREDAPALGFAVDFIDGGDPSGWERLLRSETRVIYVEAITNPLIRVADHAAVVAFARAHGLVSIIDNTFASPINFRPLELGYDLSVHSATKYLNGHSDLIAGAVIGRADLVAGVERWLGRLGGSLDPHACFLLDRGLKTLALRVRHQNESSLALARFLEQRPEVECVHYPGLPAAPDHERARELFDGFGGMLAFELVDADCAERFLDAVTIPIVGPSLGGVESLMTRPCMTSHLGQSAAVRAAMGIRDGLIRFSVGIEDPDDLVRDLGRALDAAVTAEGGLDR